MKEAWDILSNMLIIVGAGGHGKVVADTALKINKWGTIVFVDELDTVNSCLGLKVYRNIADVPNYKNADYFVAIGKNASRKNVQEMLENNGFNIVTLIHPSAIIGTAVEIGSGTVVTARVVINCATKVGKGCILNTGSTVDHDGIIEDFVHISPGTNIAGMVTVGKMTWIGIGCSVINNVNICSDCTIGAGAVVINSICQSGTYVGVPARRIIKDEEND